MMQTFLELFVNYFFTSVGVARYFDLASNLRVCEVGCKMKVTDCSTVNPTAGKFSNYWFLLSICSLHVE